jgi:hypothetical protein
MGISGCEPVHTSRRLLSQFESLSSQVNLPGSYLLVSSQRGDAFCELDPMQYEGVEYSVVQLTDGAGWRWEIRFGDGKRKIGATPISRAVAIRLAKSEIDRTLKDIK